MNAEKRKTLAEIMDEDAAEEDAAREAARPAGPDYTGDPCAYCGRPRVYLRRDGQLICEKCEQFQPVVPSPDPETPQ